MTYMKLTAAKRIVFFIYLFVIQFSNESQLKNCRDMMKVERGK